MCVCVRVCVWEGVCGCVYIWHMHVWYVCACLFPVI